MNNPDWMLSSRFPCTEPSSYQYQQQEPSEENLIEDEFQRMFGHELQQIVETEDNLDEQRRAPAARDLGQRELSQDNLNRNQTNLAEENTRDSTTATLFDQEPAAQKGKSRVKAKGQVREVAGGVEYCFENSHSWHQAVYHDDIRAELIQEASMLGRYDHPRERGKAPNDVTSYLLSQKGWGPDRDQNWPGILHRLERRGLPAADYPVGNLHYNGLLVLDLDNNPILDYVDLPATLSTEFSGEYMEAITRLDPRIGQKDFRARMPKTRRTGRNGQTVRPSYSLSTIGMRMTRFRQEQGLISWTKREGSENIRDFLMSNLPQENIEANSTRGVLPPSLVAQADSRRKNKGNHAARAGGRALSQKERQDRDDKEAQKLAMLRAAEAKSEEKTQTQIGEKRKRAACVTPDVDEVESANKRSKVISHSKTVHPVPGIPVPPQSPQSIPAPEKFRKRSRDVSCSEDNDEGSIAKRQCRRSASPAESFEKGDSGREADDATQKVVEEPSEEDRLDEAEFKKMFAKELRIIMEMENNPDKQLRAPHSGKLEQPGNRNWYQTKLVGVNPRDATPAGWLFRERPWRNWKG